MRLVDAAMHWGQRPAAQLEPVYTLASGQVATQCLFISRITTMYAIYVPEKKRISYSLVVVEYYNQVRGHSEHFVSHHTVVWLAIMSKRKDML